MNRRNFGQLALGSLLGSALVRARAMPAVVQPAYAGPVRFSFMLWALEKQAPFEQCVETVAAAGYHGIELVGEFQKWSKPQTQATMARMRSLGMVFDAMSGVKAGFAVPEESAEFMTQMESQINYALELECPKIILLSGRRVPGMDPKLQRQTAIDNLRRAADLAAKHKLEIVIEPIDPLENPTIFLPTVSDGFEIVREINREDLKVLYDFYHEQRAYGNLIEKLENNIDWVGLVHIADVPGRHEPGTGEIDYTNIYRRLAAVNYSHFIAMEYYPTTDPVESLQKARESAQQVLNAV
jgi:hydroxypyruvate isomerase